MKIKNIDNTLENIDNIVLKSLSLLDNENLYISIVFILFLYNTCIFKNINNLVSEYYDYSAVRVIVLLLIIYTSRKSYLISILLAISFMISLNYKSIMENFNPSSSSSEPFYSSVTSENDSQYGNEIVSNSESEQNESTQQETNSVTESFNNDTILDKKCIGYSQNETIGNLCNSVSTYIDDNNIQGLNNIIGYDNAGNDGYALENTLDKKVI